jgi:ABC-type branched-subunit amino acid transport system substrate-binding protein
MKTLMTALALATLLVAPALVQSANAAPPSERLDKAREQAIHECNTAAGKFSQSTWGHHQLDQYRTCMMQHGQPE